MLRRLSRAAGINLGRYVAHSRCPVAVTSPPAVPALRGRRAHATLWHLGIYFLKTQDICEQREFTESADRPRSRMISEHMNPDRFKQSSHLVSDFSLQGPPSSPASLNRRALPFRPSLSCRGQVPFPLLSDCCSPVPCFHFQQRR